MNDLTCQNCGLEYTLTNRSPRLFPNCGQSFCSQCIQGLIDNSDTTLRCPEDQVECQFFNKKIGISCFPLNFALYRLLKQRTVSDKNQSPKETPFKNRKKIGGDICVEHQKNKDLVCLTDKAVICSDCILFGVHKGHDYMRTREFVKELKGKLIGFDHKFDGLKYRDCLKEEKAEPLKRKVADKQKQLEGVIKSHADLLVHEIRNREEELRAEVDLIFSKFEETAADLNTKKKKLKEKHNDLRKRTMAIKTILKQTGVDFNFLIRHMCNEGNIFDSLKSLTEELNSVERECVEKIDKELDCFDIEIDNNKLPGILKTAINLKNDKYDYGKNPSNSEDYNNDSNLNTAAQLDTLKDNKRKSSRSLSTSPQKKVDPQTNKSSFNLTNGPEFKSLNDEELIDLEIDDPLDNNLLSMEPKTINNSFVKKFNSNTKKNNSFFRERNTVNMGLTGSSRKPINNVPPFQTNNGFHFGNSTLQNNLITPPEQIRFRRTIANNGNDNTPIRQLPSFPPVKTQNDRRTSILDNNLSNTAKLMTVEMDAEMDFARMGLTDDRLEDILPSIVKNKKVKALNLSHNNITDSGFLMLLKKLANHSSLERVYLVNNRLGDGVFVKLEKWVKRFKSIEYFNMQKCSGFKNMLRIKKYIKSLKKNGLKIEV